MGEYHYDALNRRIRKNVGGVVTDCLYFGWQCVEDRDSSNNPSVQYLWGIYLDELIQQKNIADINGFGANALLYPLQDLLCRTTGLADSSGVVREAYDTDAYGNTLIFRKSGTPPGAIAFSDSDTQVSVPTCPFIFTGQRFDAEIGLYYYKRRYYSPLLGRFLNRDPIGYEGGDLNFYRYGNSDPLKFLDVSGTSCVTRCCRFKSPIVYASIIPLGAPPDITITVNCPDTANQQLCCSAAAERLGLRDLGQAAVTNGPCPPTIRDNGPLPLKGRLAFIEVEQAPIVNLCRGGSSGSGQPWGCPQLGIAPGVPSPLGPQGGLLDAYGCAAGYTQDGEVEFFTCQVYGPPDMAASLTDEAGFARCAATARTVMREACAAGHYNRFASGCSKLAALLSNLWWRKVSRA